MKKKQKIKKIVKIETLFKQNYDIITITAEGDPTPPSNP